MKRSSTFLQAVIVLVGLGILAFMLWEPHLEGRNARATLFEIYFEDPFLAYAYVASIPFFVALFQCFKVLEYAGRDRAHAQGAIDALRTIRFCAVAMIGFVAVGELIIIASASDDRAGGVFMGLLIALVAVAFFVAATKLERMLTRSRPASRA